MKKMYWLPMALASLVACGDNDTTLTPDATAFVDAPVTPDATPDGPAPFVPPTAFAVPLSAGGPDQLQSAAGGPAGTFYLAGFAAQTLDGPKLVTVVKTSTTGPVAAFGTGGIATTTIVSATGGADEIDIAVQPSGKLIVTATVANTLIAADRDIAVIRLDGTTGALDTTFGDNGVRIINLNTALDAAQAAQRDVSRGLAVGADGAIYVHGGQRNPGLVATDSDFAVVKLTVDGALDTTFGTGGKFTLDILGSNATARGLHVLADGSVLAGGYANSTAVGSTTQAVLYKLTPAGALDPAFADNGLFHEIVLTTQTEIYNFAIHGTNLVTAGYGRNGGTSNDWISMRFNTATGVRDTTWGGVANGAVLFDPSGSMLGSNCRNAVALPGGKTLLLGSTGPSNMPAQDAVFAILDANGVLDTDFGTGIVKYPLGSNQNDQFWGGAVSGSNAIVVGYQGGGATPTAAVNDNSYGVIIPLP